MGLMEALAIGSVLIDAGIAVGNIIENSDNNND